MFSGRASRRYLPFLGIAIWTLLLAHFGIVARLGPALGPGQQLTLACVGRPKSGHAQRLTPTGSRTSITGRALQLQQRVNNSVISCSICSQRPLLKRQSSEKFFVSGIKIMVSFGESLSFLRF